MGIVIRVRDTGIGIPADTIETVLFQPFSQGDSAITRTHGGAGLGLAISKQVIESLGGSIAVASPPESADPAAAPDGTWEVVKVLKPAVNAAKSTGESKPGSNIDINNINNINNNNNNSSSSNVENGNGTATGVDAAKPGMGSEFTVRFDASIVGDDEVDSEQIEEEILEDVFRDLDVLIIASGEADRTEVQAILMECGADVTVAQGPMDGIPLMRQLANTGALEIVIADLHLPAISGADVVHIMANSANLNHTPTLLLASSLDDCRLIETLPAGTAPFIRPHTKHSLVVAVCMSYYAAPERWTRVLDDT
jgi:CheY-like chemotaxis protein